MEIKHKHQSPYRRIFTEEKEILAWVKQVKQQQNLKNSEQDLSKKDKKE